MELLKGAIHAQENVAMYSQAFEYRISTDLKYSKKELVGESDRQHDRLHAPLNWPNDVESGDA